MPLYKFFAHGDTHAPLSHKPYLRALIARLSDFNPDVYVHLGDALEGKRGAKHAKDERHNWSPVQEFRDMAEFIMQVNDAAPKAKKVWIYGNHDDNILNHSPNHATKEDAETHQALFEALVYPHLKDWRILSSYKHDTTWHLGQVAFRHGADTTSTSILKDAMLYSVQHGLHVSGHTHKPRGVAPIMYSGVHSGFWSCNPGCGLDWDRMYYMDRLCKDAWGRGWLIGEAKARGLNDGKQTYAGKSWDAKVEVFDMFSPNWAPNDLVE